MPIDLDKEARIYADFMSEIKARSRLAADIIGKLRRDTSIPYMNQLVEAESAILQTRVICELIALASLAAHSKFGLTRELLKSWHAQKTFRFLETINPDCFPGAIIPTRNQHGLIMANKPGQLTKAGLERIYNQCGRLLHRGVIRHALEGKERVYDLNRVNEWLTQIEGLLLNHTILLLKHNVVLIVIMAVPPNGDVQVAYAESGGPSQKLST